MLSLIFAVALSSLSPAFAGVHQIDLCTQDLVAKDSGWRNRSHLTAKQSHRSVALLRFNDPHRSARLFSFVIPVYRELYSGNLARLLRQISAQTIGGDRIQVVLVVNNTIEVALNHADPVLIENLQTVAWLKQIRSSLPYRLDVIDETRGFDRNMGRLRNLAAFRALRTTDVDPRRHVIVNFDADGTIRPDYLERLDSYYSHFDVDAVIARRGHTISAGASATHFRTEGVSDFYHQAFDVQNAMTYPQEGFSTPQITVRADVFLDLHGFDDLPDNEDVDLGRRLTDHRVVMAPDVLITQSARARDDGFAAATRARTQRDLTNESGEVQRGAVRRTSLLRIGTEFTTRYSNHLERQVERGRITPTEALHRFERVGRYAFPDLPLDAGSFFDGRFTENLSDRLEVTKSFRRNFMHALAFFPNALAILKDTTPAFDMPSYMLRILPGYLSGAERDRFGAYLAHRRSTELGLIRDRLADLRSLIRSGTISTAASADAFRQALRHESSLLRRDLDARISNVRATSRKYDQAASSEDRILRDLIAQFPDYLDETFADSYTHAVQEYRALNDWILRAQIDPEAYPGTETMLGIQRLNQQ